MLAAEAKVGAVFEHHTTVAMGRGMHLANAIGAHQDRAMDAQESMRCQTLLELMERLAKQHRPIAGVQADVRTRGFDPIDVVDRHQANATCRAHGQLGGDRRRRLRRSRTRTEHGAELLGEGFDAAPAHHRERAFEGAREATIVERLEQVVGLELDVPFRTAAAALKAFHGVDRRLQVRGEACGATVIDDYGHHPTEIRATLEAIRGAFDGKLIVAFQPHRYSRTQTLLQEFGGSFGLADVVMVTDIYPAGERPVPGVDGDTVAAAIRRHGHDDVRYEADKTALPAKLRELIEPGAVVLTLGAGDIWRAGDTLIREGGCKPSRRAGLERLHQARAAGGSQ